MARFDYDVVFYRVFCVTLLALAFTFSVILTNVFVDIDGLLSNKIKYLPETSPFPETFIRDKESSEEPKVLISTEDKNYDSEINPSYRTKRYIDNKFFKTVIEINESDNKSKASNRTYTKEIVERLLKLIYNGKSIKINQMFDEIKSQRTSKSKAFKEIEKNKNSINSEPKNMKLNNKNRRHESSSLLNEVLLEYVKNLYSLTNYQYEQNSPDVEGIKTQRIKRQIKIRYSDNVTTSKTKPIIHEGVKKDDDDLYIEIETHFDGKGVKGEKKKKLVRNLIDKIQKALHSDIEEKRDNVEHIKFVKRSQDPIYSQGQVSLNENIPMELIEHRILDSTGKTSQTHENIANRLGDSWKKQYYGPSFLSISEGVNSAEMNEVNVDYDSVLRNGIPKRLQQPLNTEDEGESTELLNSNSGNVTLFLKGIDGSGFAIGFNQYEGMPPDKDSMKMFNGIENLIREYHKTYDQEDNVSNEFPVNKVNNFVGTYHEMAKRNVENLHKVYKRSITEEGTKYDANTFKIFFKENPSYNNHLNMFKGHNQKLKFYSGKNNLKNNNIYLITKNLLLNEKIIPVLVEKIIPNKKLKSSETLTIANLVNRKRRSLSVKKITNLKSKIKLNRYLNTKAMANKKVFLKNKRNKRHVNNIKIIARDQPILSQKYSDENIFFISKENFYSDKETAVKIAEPKKNYKITEDYDEESPFNNIYRIQNPHLQTTLTENLYNTGLNSNDLMSKYPHILLDKSSNSKEEIYFDEKQYRKNDKPYRIEASPKPIIGKQEIEGTTKHNRATVLQDLNVPRVEEMVSAIMPPLTGNNYRITVKMSPKNKTYTNTGFKEVHTMVNKSYDINGLRYYTLFNVSQISKIEKLNKTDETQETVQPLRVSNHFIDQQKQINALLKLHKKRVDIQVNNLLRESNHLEKMIESNKEYNIDKTILLLTDDDNGLDTVHEDKFIDSLKKLQDNIESKPPTTTPATFKSITVLPSTTETVKINKTKIIETIKQNENITLEILRKIDTNTQILQKFIQKFPDKSVFDKKALAPIKLTKKSALEMKSDLSKDWKSYGVNKDAFFVPNELKNGTIPFVAYQQSIPMKNKTPQPLARLLYRGYIHTNNIVENLNDNNFKKPAPKIEPNLLVNTDNSKRKFNESKFFLDEINNFNKVVPSEDRVISANIKKINITNIV